MATPQPDRSLARRLARLTLLPCSRAPMDPTILILCTGNATRSVIAGAVLKAHLPHVEIATGGTMSIDGLPMSWRTKAGFEAVGVTPPSHRSRQVYAEDLDRATLIVGLAPEHVNWVRRTHPVAASRAATLKRLVHDLAADDRPLAERVAELDLAAVELEPWEEVVDPGGGEVEAFIACAEEVVPLVGDLAARLRLAPAMADWGSEDWKGERATRWVEMADAVEAQLAPISDEMIEAATARSAAMPGIEWVTADLATWSPATPFDAVISRFGVMFFDAP